MLYLLGPFLARLYCHSSECKVSSSDRQGNGQNQKGSLNTQTYPEGLSNKSSVCRSGRQVQVRGKRVPEAQKQWHEAT